MEGRIREMPTYLGEFSAAASKSVTEFRKFYRLIIQGKLSWQVLGGSSFVTETARAHANNTMGTNWMMVRLARRIDWPV